MKENEAAKDRAAQLQTDREQHRTNSRPFQRILTAEDFVIRRKEALKGPQPINITAPPVWSQKVNVSQPKTHNSWEGINSEGENLFGKSAVEMINFCGNFWANYTKLSSVAEKKASYLNFFLNNSN